ncbi:glycosyltransferase family A protein, partial [Acinetobacter baumannii]
SLIAQTSRDFRLVIVNNRSTDGSPALVAGLLAESGLRHAHVFEDVPGFLPALVRGIAEADSELLAVANADVIYPPHYVATILRL